MLGHGDLTKTGSICRYHETTKTNLKMKHEIYYVIESFYSRGAGKLRLCLFQICYNNTYINHFCKCLY